MIVPAIHLTTCDADKTALLRFDVLIHKFIDEHKQKRYLGTTDQWTTVYSPRPHQYEHLADTYFYHKPLEQGETYKFHGTPFRAYSFHSPETRKMLADDETCEWIVSDLNEDGVPRYICNPVPAYHETGEHFEEIQAILKERGLEVKYNVIFQHPRVEIKISIGDYIAHGIVTADESHRPSHLLNSAYVIVLAKILQQFN